MDLLISINIDINYGESLVFDVTPLRIMRNRFVYRFMFTFDH